jgi:hypothetical protein
MAKGVGMLAGLTKKMPAQMKKGDPKMASGYPSVDSGADRSTTAPTPKTLGPRDA